MKKTEKTNVMRLLEQKKIDYKSYDYTDTGVISGAEVAKALRIQYGGSMKPSNAKELMAMRNIDGGLIGGAALKAEDFAAIVNYPRCLYRVCW